MVEDVRDSYQLGVGYSFAEQPIAPNRLAYVDGYEVIVRDLAAGRVRKVFDDDNRHVACPLVWSPDGNTLFHSHEQIFAIDMKTGEARAVTSFAGGERFRAVWNLECSPDGRTLRFMHVQSSRLYVIETDGSGLREIPTPAHLWQFVCNWDRNVVLVGASRPPTLWRTDLDGRNARQLSEGAVVDHLQITADGEHAIYHLQSAVWTMDLRTGEAKRIVTWGKVPALSPDGSAIAFMRDDHDVFVQRLGEAEPECVLRAPQSQERRRGSYATAPRWSPDGRLLWMSSTIARRLEEPRDPAFVESLRKKAATAKQRRARERRADDGAPEMDYEGSIEAAYWEFEHATGLVEVAARRVWLQPGYWSDVAWAPQGA